MIDISKAFGTSSETVSDFFQRPGVGYYIPLYQREYSWDTENIDQLIEDICRGVDSLLSKDEAIRFLGTVILVKETKPNANINPLDNRALPSRIDNVIDGQQRISTIALLACLLYQKLYQIRERLPNGTEYGGLIEAVDIYLATLLEVFSVDIRRGLPPRKPIIIRGSVDGWTFDGDDSNYKSDVASFLASFIRAIQDKSKFPQPLKDSLVGKNLKRINLWLNNVEKVPKNDEDFPPAWKIIDTMDEEYLWSYKRPELESMVKNRSNPMSDVEKQVCSLVQLFAFCYYLLHRCCFTLIEPVSESWAFDMFQSLNATGTPLTAIETFKPLVVNSVNSSGKEFKGSKSEEYFAQVDKLLSPLRSASSKSQLTNEYLTLFGLTYNGFKKPSRQFSEQRGWLTEKYNACKSIEDKEEFIHRMGNIATYWLDVIKFMPSKLSAIPKTEGVIELHKTQAAFCILYLQDAGHKMANTVLSRFYSLTLRNKSKADEEFVFACKAVAAFFTLWRSAQSNAGLDDIYRTLMREHMSWEKGDSELNIEVLKKFFLAALTQQGIGDENKWKTKATQYLRYENAKKVCKFSLLVTSHDTISDPDERGLMKIGTTGSSPSYLEPKQWYSDDFKSIEHVAPQKQKLSPESNWDVALYDNDEIYQKIGNLTLLPTEINSSAGDKQWIEKWIYYRHLSEKDLGELANLKQEAKKNGVDLKDNTINLLKSVSHKSHIEPIVQLGAAGQWDKSFVEKRTERICDILWQRMYEWLS